MNSDEQQLKEKALLLLRRERELFEMRVKHERVTEWLRLTQLLPQLFDRTLPVPELYKRLRKSLLSGLRLQRVAFLELTPGFHRAIAPPGSERPLSPEAAAFLVEKSSGLCNTPDDPGSIALAEAVGLHRFIWSEIRVAGANPVLMVAGFDRALAEFQGNFDDSDAAHVENVARHVQTLLGNLALLCALEQEKDRLQITNQTLERQDRELQAASEQLRTANESLEERVTERTQALAQRTRDMRLVLDNVSQAFMTIDREGRLAQERSAMVDAWFGGYEGTPRFIDFMNPVDREFAERFDLGYEALLEEVLPRDLSIAQLPSRLARGDRSLRCSYELLTEGPDITGLLIVISDITEALRRAQEEAEQQELLALFQGLMRDRAGYLGFAEEAGLIVQRLVEEPFELITTKRLLHTLKGIAAMAGATLIAELCHQAEEQLDGDETQRPHAGIERLGHRWAAITEALDSSLDDRRRGTIEIAWEDVEALGQEIRRGAPAPHLLASLELWRLEPVELPLGRLGQYARALAQRLGKGNLAVAIDAPAARLDANRWSGLWSSLIQVVRNAVDHGIEPPEQRRACGKSAQGHLSLRLRRTREDLEIELEDDGRGIDWARVRSIAEQRGIPHRGHDQLVQALLDPGFTTRSEVTTTSGRGVGLSVVREQVTALGGSIAVMSDGPLGCLWRLSFPLAKLHPADVAGLAAGGGTHRSPMPRDQLAS